MSEALEKAAQALHITEPEGEASSSKPAIYIDETGSGSDEHGDGTKAKPYATALGALLGSGLETRLFIRKAPAPGDVTKAGSAQDAENGGYESLAKSARKKAEKGYEQHSKKRGKEAAEGARRAEAASADAKRLEDSKSVVIEEPNGSYRRIKIQKAVQHRDQKVQIFGWVHRVRPQGGRMFLTLRDGTGYLQCTLSGLLTQTYDALTLTRESTIEVKGTLKPVPEGLTAPDGHELIVDWWRCIGRAPGGEEAITNRVAEDTGPSILADLRHLQIRGDTASAVLKVRAATLKAFRAEFENMSLIEVTPPCMVQTQVEGGGTLFAFQYYGEQAYLTQSSQLYLETVLPSLGDCFCVQESFRAETSHTRRHLSEYTHLEAELGFLSFEDLLEHIEQLICGTIERILADPLASALIRQLHPEFTAPQRPFMRMDYRDAIQWLNDHDIRTGENLPHRVGDDIAEAAERKMTDALNVPIFLTRFPREIKAFYMKRCPEDDRFTESVDVLMPGVGEIVGGSMRMSGAQELLEAYGNEGIDPTPYYWYTDQRKYGTCEHGGYGLGVERFLAWLTKRFTVRDCSLYPRYTDRCTP